MNKERRTHVQEALEAEDNMSLLTTLHLMMNLMEFFNRCADQKWEEAWNVIDQLEVIPKSDKDMSFRIESFHSMDDYLKRSFHHIALAAMESLHHQHLMLKTGAGKEHSAGAVEQRLNELKMRARILVTFAGLIQMYNSGDTHARIARMEAYMM